MESRRRLDLTVRRRWALVSSTGSLVATLVVTAGLTWGEGQPSAAGTEVARGTIPSPSETAGEVPEPLPIDPPTPPGAAFPALAAESATTVSQGHDLLMTWLEPGEAGERLKFARFSGQAWTPPVTITEPVSILSSMDRPSLTVIDTQGVRRTLLARTGDVIARSGDAGRTWVRLPVPALPFASFAGGDEGGYAFWLATSGDGTAKLLGTRILAGETILDPGVADGSGTAAAMTWDGPVVVYRGEDADGTQNLAVVRRQDARWTPPRPVHATGWRPVRKPEGGPRVAARHRRVAVAWTTAAPPGPRVLVAFSSDAGRTFGAPFEVDVREGDRVPWDAVDVALDDNGDALVLWLATTGPTEATLNLARVSADGHRGEGLILSKRTPPRLVGIPQIARAGDRVAVAWTEGTPSRVRAVTVPLAAIPAADHHRGSTMAREGASEVSPSRGQVGELAPDLELLSLAGEPVSLASLRGRAVLLNLWATWCIPCIAEMPELAALQERHGPAGLVVVGLNVDSAEDLGKVQRFVAERKVPFPVWLDPQMLLHRALRVRSLPATFVLDRTGRIVLRRDGVIAADDPELGEALHHLLDGP
jgi:thiol-disulfide isomerase/thioredoxin